MQFHKSTESSLYVAPPDSSSGGTCAYLLSKTCTFTLNELDLTSSLNDLGGHYVFSSSIIDFDNNDTLVTVVQQLTSYIDTHVKPGQRAILWLDGNPRQPASRIMSLSFTSRGSSHSVSSALNAPILGESLRLEFGTTAVITAQDTALNFNGNSASVVRFSGDKSLMVAAHDASIAVFGDQPGVIAFDEFFNNAELTDKLKVGWCFTAAASGGSKQNRSVMIDFFRPSDPIEFSTRLRFSIDVTDIHNRSVQLGNTTSGLKSGFSFLSNTGLSTYFLTREGHPIDLLPVIDGAPKTSVAQLVFNTSFNSDGPALVPAGDYWLCAQDKSAGDKVNLLCGLSATVTVTCINNTPTELNGHRLRFHVNCPAYAPQYPIPQSSVLGPPVNPEAQLLNKEFTTSWASIESTETPVLYSAQPTGAALFGKDPVIHAHQNQWLGLVERPTALPIEGPPIFPLPPLAGAILGDEEHSFNAAALHDFERVILAPTRHTAIATSTNIVNARKTNTGDEVPLRATTPSGLVAEIAANGQWQKVSLAWSKADLSQVLCFTQLSSELHGLFQTNQLFAVVANANYLGTLSAPSDPIDDNSRFYNTISIGDWSFRINVGSGNHYGDYRNVMLLKFRHGRVSDLVKNPTAWAQAVNFALPGKNSDADELVMVSQWLQDYIEGARGQLAQGNLKLQHFINCVDSPDWSGILTLRVDITELPGSLNGLLGGMDPDAFFAHHIGIDVTAIEGADINITEESSVFGLIDYLDPGFDSKHPERPVHQNVDGAFDFAVLNLNVLFENTHVKEFNSNAQLLLRELLGVGSTTAGDRENERALLLHGQYQLNDGHGELIMNTKDSQRLALRDSIMHSAEISKASLVTDTDTSKPSNSNAGETPILVRFAMRGHLEFAEIPQFDLFSFGAESDEISTNQGLSFAELILEMKFLASAPTKRQFTLNSSRIVFDPGRSAWRNNSLFGRFPLRVVEFIVAANDTSPNDQGFLPVACDNRLVGTSSPWLGLRFELDLGTPGALADSAGFSAQLLLSWTPTALDGDNNYPAQLDIKLPGTTGADALGLQGVVKVAIARIGLHALVSDTQDVSFLLKLNNIALSFLGLANLPPSGSTSFYLFGNPGGAHDDTALGWYALYKNKPSASSDEHGKDK